MCGYHNYDNIRIFLNNNIIKDGADELQRYVRWTNGDAITPTKATNLKTAKVARVNVKRGSLNPIIPIKISKQNLRIDGSEDVEPSTENKEHIIESVKAAFVSHSIENYNCDAQTDEILGQVDSFESDKFIVHIIGKQGNKVVPKTSAPAVSKIHGFFTTKTSGKLGSSNGMPLEGGIIVIRWFSAAFVEYGISKGDIFIDARTVSVDTDADRRTPKPLIPPTTRKEVFCRKLETGETVVNNGSYTISLVPETMNNIDAMIHSLSELIEISLQASNVIVKPRKITSNQIGDIKWQGVLVNEQVYNGFKKSGRIYKEIKTRFGVELKIHKKMGAKLQELAATNIIRLSDISW
jgi:hypothetical protein